MVVTGYEDALAGLLKFASTPPFAFTQKLPANYWGGKLREPGMIEKFLGTDKLPMAKVPSVFGNLD